jgi:hypothetical protein
LWTVGGTVSRARGLRLGAMGGTICSRHYVRWQLCGALVIGSYPDSAARS